jgi:hypothetical protein
MSMSSMSEVKVGGVGGRVGSIRWPPSVATMGSPLPAWEKVRGGTGHGMKRWRIDGSVDARMSIEDAPESANREEEGAMLTFSTILPSIVVGRSIIDARGRAAGGVPGSCMPETRI